MKSLKRNLVLLLGLGLLPMAAAQAMTFNGTLTLTDTFGNTSSAALTGILGSDWAQFDPVEGFLTDTLTLYSTQIEKQSGEVWDLTTLYDWNENTGLSASWSWDVTLAGTVEDPFYILTAQVGQDGIPGDPLPDGPFTGWSLAASGTTAVPLPAAAWLFATGLIGLAGTARRKSRRGR